MAKKWIINDGKLVLGDVPYHLNLAQNHRTTKGGGHWAYEKETNTLYLFGRSIDFGRALAIDLKQAQKEGAFQYDGHLQENELIWLKDVNIKFSSEDYLQVAMVKNEPIKTLENA